MSGENGILSKASLAKASTVQANQIEYNKLNQSNNIMESYTTSRGTINSNHYIIDTGYDSTANTWWRLYNDSWLEQGSFVSVTAGTTVTFPKEFNGIKYTPNLTHNTNSTINTMYKVLSVLDRNSTGMTISITGGGALFWSAEGFAADTVMQNYT